MIIFHTFNLSSLSSLVYRGRRLHLAFLEGCIGYIFSWLANEPNCCRECIFFSTLHIFVVNTPSQYIRIYIYRLRHVLFVKYSIFMVFAYTVVKGPKCKEVCKLHLHKDESLERLYSLHSWLGTVLPWLSNFIWMYLTLFSLCHYSWS